MNSKFFLAAALLTATTLVAAGCDKNAEKKDTVAAAPAKVASVESDVVALPPPPKDSDVIASVGDKKMTWAELNKQVDAMVQGYTQVTGQAIPSEQLTQAKQEFRRNQVQAFMVDSVIAAAAKEFKVTVDDAFRAKQIAELEARQGKKLDELLKMFPMGEAKAKALLESQWLELRLLEQEVFSKINVSEKEVADALAKNEAEIKLISDEMAGYAKQIAEGTAKFEDLVKANSLVKNEMPVPEAQLPMMIPDEAARKQIADTREGGITTALRIPGAMGLFKVVKRTPAVKANDTEAKAKIDALRERILKGEDFAKLAKENSDCPSGAQGGSLGEFGKGAMVPEFEKAAFTQKVGEVGEPVKTQFGWHLVLVTDRNDKDGKVSASHILLKTEDKPASVTLLPLIKQVPEKATKEQVTATLTETRKRQAALDFFNAQKKKLGVSCTLYPDLAK